MPTTSQQLEDFAAILENEPVWTLDLQGRLMDMIREPAMTVYGQVIPPLNRASAMDNIYRCKPKGWVHAEQQLGPNTAGVYPGSVANMSLWTQPAGQPYIGLQGNHSVGTLKIVKTLAVAMLVATTRAWAQILREAGR